MIMVIGKGKGCQFTLVEICDGERCGGTVLSVKDMFLGYRELYYKTCRTSVKLSSINLRSLW